MRPWRPIQLALVVLLQAVLGIWLPAHHHSPASACESTSRCPQEPADQHQDQDADHCSICLLARNLTTPPEIRPVIVQPQLLELVVSPDPFVPESIRPILPFFGRAPPLAV